MDSPALSQAGPLKPPVVRVGWRGWIKANLFNSWLNSLITVGLVYLLWLIIPPLLNWFFFEAVLNGDPASCRVAHGACWAFIKEKLRFIIFGFYPYGEQWRPLVVLIILVCALVYTRDRRNWHRRLVYIWSGVLIVIISLMAGGILGLSPVSYEKWGGLPLTLFLTIIGILGAYPLGIFLALGRRSKMPVVRVCCVVYIELIRGVPLISLLFMSAVMFPLLLPQGMVVDKLLRAQAAIILFTAAYIAEVVRGGLQAMPKGQYEAAASISLNYFQTMRKVILPQALKIVIPPTVNHFVGVVRDTSLVLMIALLDLLNTTKTALTDSKWLGFSSEAYVFVAVIYFIICFSMAQYSRRLERELSTDSEKRA